MESKSSKGSFNKASGKTVSRPKQHRNYSHHELTGMIDRYASFTKTGKQKQDLERIKKDYQDREDKRPGQNMDRYMRWHQGHKFGPPTQGWKDLDKGHKEQAQSERNKVANKVKRYRHVNFSLSKDHKEALKRTKPKGKDIIKD